MRHKIWKAAALLLWAVILLSGKTEYAVQAKQEQYPAFLSGDVMMLKKEEKSYVMQVTVENSGEDFTGTVQVVFASLNTDNCAYNTEITLPAQGKKQFTIRVTDTAADTAKGICALNFVDEKGNVLQSLRLSNVFRNTMTEIQAGVLSENYEGLVHMEAKGESLDMGSMSYPVKLRKLQEGSLKEQLEGVYFLIIDQFDVSSLSGEDIQAVQNWVKDGGWMLVGTGEYAKQTLSGFDQDFMDVHISEISEQGEENIISANADRNGYYYMYREDGIDFTNMAAADLSGSCRNGNFYESMENPAVVSTIGKGAVAVFYCCLGEEELRKADSYTIASMYQELMGSSGGYYSDEYSEWGYIRQRCLAFIDHINTEVDFTWLKVMIFIYVVLVGPVFYLILRKCKKCEWYWIGAPVLGMFFIAGVYLLGQGIRVKEARVYSVTAQKADSDYADTYFMAYHAGTRPWEVSLKDHYKAAGPGAGWSRYYYGGSQNADQYYYTVRSGSEGLSVGIKPEENFDNGFFYAEGSARHRGEITCKNLKHAGAGAPEGTITNETDCDMAYMAVFYNENILVFSDVKAGETIDLQRDYGNGKCVYEYSSYSYSPDDVLYDMLSMYSYHDDKGYAQDDMAALLIGMGIADDERPEGAAAAVVIGVVKNYDRITTGKCSELSYGCLYTYAEMKGGPHASN